MNPTYEELVEAIRVMRTGIDGMTAARNAYFVEAWKMNQLLLKLDQIDCVDTVPDRYFLKLEGKKIFVMDRKNDTPVGDGYTDSDTALLACNGMNRRANEKPRDVSQRI